MNQLTTPAIQALADSYDQVNAILSDLQEPTEASVQKILSDTQGAGIDSIVPYTGYYSMDAAPGAFLSIDTVETYYQLSRPITVSVSVVTVSVSMDGSTSQTYKLDQSSSFNNDVLTIPGVLTITLTRGYQDGSLVTFSGIVKGVAVTGSTQFNPITLPTFIGQYKLTPAKTVLSITASGIAFDFGSGLQTIKFYTFTPLMFVLMFNDPNTGEKYVVMMGTAGGMGLACYIQHGATGAYAVTIPPATQTSGTTKSGTKAQPA